MHSLQSCYGAREGAGAGVAAAPTYLSTAVSMQAGRKSVLQRRRRLVHFQPPFLAELAFSLVRRLRACDKTVPPMPFKGVLHGLVGRSSRNKLLKNARAFANCRRHQPLTRRRTYHCIAKYSLNRASRYDVMVMAQFD